MGRVRSNKARTPQQQRGIETKAKIIEAAKVLFSQKGFHKTNALEIAAQAGVATGSFYSYFNDKKELLLDLLKQFYDEAIMRIINATTDELLQAKDGRKVVHYVVHTLYHQHEIQPELHRELYPLVLLDKDVHMVNVAQENKVIELLAALFEHYQDLLRIQDYQVAAELVYKICDDFIHRVIYQGMQADKDILIGELEDILCRYLLKTVEGSGHTA